MKDFNNIMVDIDRQVEKKIMPFWQNVQKYFPIFGASFFFLLISFFVFRVFYNKPYFNAAIISKDIEKIVFALDKIDRDCSILSIEEKHNTVDFLNVVKFTGSEVGCLNLAYPKNWKGPYLFDNPTFQGKPYVIVKTKDGAFIVPGDGVKLPNGLRVGKDLVINYDSSISKMLNPDGALNYKGRLLGAKLEFIIGDWPKPGLKKEEIKEISDTLEEFNAAMPFTQNQTAPYQC